MKRALSFCGQNKNAMFAERTATIQLFLALGLAAMLALPGCGDSVSGKVTLDGEPVERGTILFYPTDGHADAEVARIVAGQYSAQLPVGTKRVEITANRLQSDKTDSLGMPLIEQAIPDRYNRQSELQIEVESSNAHLDFELRSK